MCSISAVGTGKDALVQKLSSLFTIVLGSVQVQTVNTSPLIHLWSCIPSAITPLRVFTSSLLFLLCSMPVEVDLFSVSLMVRRTSCCVNDFLFTYLF